jgi:glycosyltransferase involved in cell wall biosynthesis
VTDLPTRVGYVVTHHPRISQTFITAEIESLRSEGVVVDIFAMNTPDPSQIRTEKDRAERATTTYLKEGGAKRATSALLAVGRHPRALLHSTRLAIQSADRQPSRLARRLGHLVEAWIVWQEAAERGTGHLHAHFGQAPSMIACLAVETARAAGVGPTTWSFTVHGPSEIADPGEAQLALKVGSAQLTVAVCEFTKDLIVAACDPADAGRVKVLRCGVAVNESAPSLPRSPGEPFVVMSVGRIVMAKGFGVLIDAAARLAASGAPINVHIIGDGPDRETLETRARTEGIADRVVWHGEQEPDEVARLLESADVFCLASYDEGLPVAIMEAVAKGVPVVATDVGGVGELIQGETGWLIDAGSVSQLEQALSEAVARPDVAAARASKAFAVLAERHESGRCLATFRDAVGEAAEQ